MREHIYQETGGHCWYCGKKMIVATGEMVNSKDGKSNDWFTIDHIIPLIKGGTDDNDNLRPCCMGCNREKKNYSVEQHRKRVHRRLLGIPRFTPEQAEWLRSQGFEFPTDNAPKHIFWGERIGHRQTFIKQGAV